MKTLPKIPVLLIITNMMCGFIHADFDLAKIIKTIGSCEGPRLSLDLSGDKFDLIVAQIIGQNLQFNTTIEHLDLSNNGMNGECASAIMNALKDNPTITCLDLSNNLIDSISYKFDSTAEQNKALKTIILTNNLLKNDSAQSMAKMILANEALEEIYVGGNYFSENKLQQITYVVSDKIKESGKKWRYDAIEEKLLKVTASDEKTELRKVVTKEVRTPIEYFDEDDIPNWKHRRQETEKQKWRKKKTLAEPSSVSEEEKTESDSSSTSEEEKMGSDSSFTEDEGQY